MMIFTSTYIACRQYISDAMIINYCELTVCGYNIPTVSTIISKRNENKNFNLFKILNLFVSSVGDAFQLVSYQSISCNKGAHPYQYIGLHSFN